MVDSDNDRIEYVVNKYSKRYVVVVDFEFEDESQERYLEGDFVVRSSVEVPPQVDIEGIHDAMLAAVRQGYLKATGMATSAAHLVGKVDGFEARRIRGDGVVDG